MRSLIDDITGSDLVPLDARCVLLSVQSLCEGDNEDTDVTEMKLQLICF